MEGAATQQQVMDLQSAVNLEITSVKDAYEARIQEVAADVNARQAKKFASVEEAFRGEQVRLGKVFEECETNWKKEQKRMNNLLDVMQASVTSTTNSVSQMADGNLEEVMKKMLEQDERDTKRVQFLHEFVQTGPA